MPNEVKQLEGGKLEVKLETGEIFTGDPLEVTNKMAEAHVNTKRWGQEFKQKFETLQSNPPAPPAPPPVVDPNEVQLQQYVGNLAAKSLGFNDINEAKSGIARMNQTAEQVENDRIAMEFMAARPDFPNTPEAIEKLSGFIEQNNWQFRSQDMMAAYDTLVRGGQIKPLTAEEQNRSWSQNLQQSNQAPNTPPPMVRSSSPDASQDQSLANQIWTAKTLDEARAAALKAQRGY